MPDPCDITGERQAERNATPGHLIGELLDKGKHRRSSDRDAPTGQQRANPWGQVWPG